MYLNDRREFNMNLIRNGLSGRGKSDSELEILCDEFEKEVAKLEKGVAENEKLNPPTENEIPGLECMWIPGEDCDWYSKKTHCPEMEEAFVDRQFEYCKQCLRGKGITKLELEISLLNQRISEFNKEIESWRKIEMTENEETCIHKEIANSLRTNEDIEEWGALDIKCTKSCGMWFECHGICIGTVDDYNRALKLKENA